MKLQILKKWKGFIAGVAIIIFMKIFISNPLRVEKYYSTGMYPFISKALRVLFGWLPFSAGDLFYMLAAVLLIATVFKTFRQYRFTLKAFGIFFKKIILILLWVYILFNFLWGLNYYRTGFQSQLNIKPETYTVQDLEAFSQALITKLNDSRFLITEYEIKDSSYKIVFDNAIKSYKKTSLQFPFLTYKYRSVKPSMFNTTGNYLGFLGYYNPFTGEAQVNTKTPSFILPFTACHEIGHQLGYGSESEASFAAYLTAMASGNKVFEYSSYFELFIFANQQLFFTDSNLARKNFLQLDTLVKKDIHQYQNYLAAYNNPLEPFITSLYGSYLKANNQPKGMQSYNEVLAWVIAYHKKYGHL